jgi:hypothetical protein
MFYLLLINNNIFETNLLNKIINKFFIILENANKSYYYVDRNFIKNFKKLEISLKIIINHFHLNYF